MNQKEKLTEATVLALQGKLVEVTNQESVINNTNINEATSDISDIFQSLNYRYKYIDCQIKNSTIYIEYQTQENIYEDDAANIASKVKPEIQKIVNNYGLQVNKCIMDIYDRSGQYENGELEQTISLKPGVLKKVSKSKLSEERIAEIGRAIIYNDFSTADDVITNGMENIYDWIRACFDPKSDYYIKGIEEYSDLDTNDKVTMQALALYMIKKVTYNVQQQYGDEEWTVTDSKNACGYNNFKKAK